VSGLGLGGSGFGGSGCWGSTFGGSGCGIRRVWVFVGRQPAMRYKTVSETIKGTNFLAILFPFARIDTTSGARSLFFAIF